MQDILYGFLLNLGIGSAVIAIVATTIWIASIAWQVATKKKSSKSKDPIGDFIKKFISDAGDRKQ
jgi:hypothetical protein